MIREVFFLFWKKEGEKTGNIGKNMSKKGKTGIFVRIILLKP